MQILWANRKREECVGGVSDDREAPSTSQNRLGWWKSILIGSSETATLVGLSKDDPVETETPQDKGLIVKELDALKANNTIATLQREWLAHLKKRAQSLLSFPALTDSSSIGPAGRSGPMDERLKAHSAAS
uniref:Uncharacterized protein n=1 Tax=Tanacetum cinerariifolium TaxID=118510 RepID=A0A699TJS5_TANCI|nr:hypothetical protein [Tanacetum cinerariifolium]